MFCRDVNRVLHLISRHTPHLVTAVLLRDATDVLLIVGFLNKLPNLTHVYMSEACTIPHQYVSRFNHVCIINHSLVSLWNVQGLSDVELAQMTSRMKHSPHQAKSCCSML